ncbi:hypothetical protein ACO1O0_003034 [Amphichorda felina]
MECRPASSLPAAQIAQLFNSSFTGYIAGDVNFTAETFTAWAETNLVNLPRSYVFFDPSISADGPIAFGLIALREDQPRLSRLGTMGVAPIAQGKGVGTRALAMIVEREREAGQEELELECIQTNTRALAMYRRIGFKEMRELPGWEHEAVPAGSDEFRDDPALEEVTVAEVDALVKKHGAADMPWQVYFMSRLSIAQRAFRLGHAWCVTTDPEDKEKNEIKIASLIVEPEWRGQGEATRLARAMMGRFRGKKWCAPGVIPAEYGDGLAKKVGAVRPKIGQFQMRLKLK